MKEINKQNGNTKVTIKKTRYGIEVLTMVNGFQWTGFNAHDELLKMLKEAIEEYNEL